MDDPIDPLTSSYGRCTGAQNRCIVPSCDSRYDLDVHLSFHKMPRKNVYDVTIRSPFGDLEKIDKHAAWKRALKIKNVTSRSSLVCGLHFAKEDYIFPDIPRKVKKLKKWAIPSLNIPLSSTEIKKEKISSERSVRRQKRAVGPRPCPIPDKPETPPENDRPISPLFLDVGQYCDTSLDTTPSEKNNLSSDQDVDDTDSSSNKKCKEVGVQTDIVEPKFFLKNEEELRFVTGLESFEVVDLLVKLVDLVLNKQMRHLVNKVSLKDWIILTYMRIKHKMSHGLLAVLFNCDYPQESQEIFKIISEVFEKHLLVENIRQPLKEDVTKSIISLKMSQETDNSFVILASKEEEEYLLARARKEEEEMVLARMSSQSDS